MPRTLGSLAASAFLLGSLVVMPLVPAAEDDTPPGLVRALRGHKEAVYAIAFTADGKQIVTGSGDPSIKVWQADTGKVFKTFAGGTGHTGLVLALALSPDGTQIASGGADNTLRVWDFPTSKPVREFALATDSRSVAVSPDGLRVAGGSDAGVVRVWNAADGKQLHELAGHAGAVTGLAFSPNGQTIASVGHDGTLRYWNAADGKSFGSTVAHPGPVSGVAFNTAGSLAYTTGPDGTLRYWTLPPVPSKPLTPKFDSPVTALALSSDGSQVVTGAGKVVRTTTANDLQQKREFAGATDTIRAVAASAGGALVAAGTDDRRLLLWKDKDAAPLMDLPAHAGAVTGVAFNPAGSQLASVGKDGVLRLWSVPPAAPRVILHPENVVASGLSGDGARLLTAAADKTLRLYKLDNVKTPERQFPGHPGAVKAVALGGDGKAFVSGDADGVIRLWSSARAEPVAAVGAHAAALSSLQMAGADRFLSASADGSIKLWQVAPAPKNAILSHAGVVSSLALTPDGAKLVTGCDDKQVRVWTLATGAVERTLAGPTLAVCCVAASAKGDRIAAGSADKSVYVWDAAGKLVMKSPPLAAAVTGVGLTADGKQVVAALASGDVLVLDAAAGKKARELVSSGTGTSLVAVAPRGDNVVCGSADGHVTFYFEANRGLAAKIERGSPVTALAVSRDGTRVAVGGADKAVRVYALPAGKLEGTIATESDVRGLSFGADSKRLAVAGADGKTRLFDAAGALEEFFAQQGAVNGVAFAADGKTVFTAGADKTARRWSPALVWQARHDGGASQAVLNGRGDRVISAGADGLVKVWNAADGKPIQAIRAHAGAIAGVAVSPDGGKVVSVGADRVARLWDLGKLPAARTGGKELDKAALEMPLPAKGEPLSCGLEPTGTRVAVGVAVAVAGKEQVFVFDAATGKELLADAMPARSLAWLADGRSLVASGADRGVRIVDVNILGAFEAHPGGCAGVAWHSNGTQLLTGGADKRVKLWTVATGKLARTFPAMGGPVDGVAFSNDFSQVAAVAGTSVRLWAAADGKQLVAKELPAPAKGISINSDRTRFAVACDDGRARVYESATGAFLQGFAHEGAVSGVVFAPASPPTLFTAGVDGTASRHTLSARNAYDAKTALAGLSVSPNSAQVATAGADGKVRLSNASSGVLDKTIDAGTPQTCVAFSRNSAVVACGGGDDKVRLYTVADGKLLSVFTAPTTPRGLGFHPNNRSLVMAGADGAVVAWDVNYNAGQPLPAEFGKVQQTFAHAGQAFEVAFPASTTGAVFYTAGADKTIKAFKLASETPIRNIPHPGTVNSLAYNKDGTVLATGCGDGQVRLFDIAKGALSKAVVAHPGRPNQPSAIYAVAFSPDGKGVLSASFDQSLKLWSVPDGKLIREFKAHNEKTSPKGHQEAVLCAAFSPDGTRIASGGMDRAIKIWNVTTGAVERELIDPATRPPSAHPGWVYALRWVDGGKKIVSAGGAPRLKGSLATWDATTGKRIESKELAIGTIYALGVSADEKFLGLGTGGSLRSEKDYNTGLILKR